MHALISLLIITLSINEVSAQEYTNYYNITMSNQQYNNLLNLGFTEDEIYYMNEETFEQNKDFESTLEVKNENFYKTVYTDLNGNSYSTEITQDEYENQSLINPRGTVTTEYKDMVSTLSRNSDGTFRYKVSLIWRNMPSKRSYDIIGVGFSDNVYISSLVNFSYYYCYQDPSSCTTSGLYYDKKVLSTGGSTVYKLPTGDIRSLSATLYYDVSKNNPSQTITSLLMYGDYAHATSTVTPNNYTNHTINSSGIQFFSGLSAYYDEIPTADSGWVGTW